MTKAEKETLDVLKELGFQLKQVHALKAENAALKAEVEKFNSIQHTQPAKCLNCYHWAYATKARCSRGNEDRCVIKPGTQQAGA